MTLKIRKNLFKIMIAVVISFLILNIVWFSWRAIKYGGYSKGFTKTVFSEFLTPRYTLKDSGGFEYYVKYPDYFKITGNLSIGMPDYDGSEMLTDCLIIWPKVFGQNEYGILIYEEGKEYQIYLDKSGNALYQEDEEMVLKHKDEITDLFEHARKQWNIK